MNEFETVVAILLMGFFASDVLAAYLLFSTTARSNYSIIALNERAFVAIVQSVSAGLLGLLGANRIFNWHLSTEIVLIILSVAVLIQALPALMWLFLYFRHKFGPRG